MKRERRKAPRQDITWEAHIFSATGSPVGDCKVVNISTAGAKLILRDKSDVPDRISLVLSRNGQVRRECEVTWRSEEGVGVHFVRAPSAERKDETSYRREATSRSSIDGVSKS